MKAEQGSGRGTQKELGRGGKGRLGFDLNKTHSCMREKMETFKIVPYDFFLFRVLGWIF